eukprot:m.692387 g.692387  ORF g.692387 m.692387 type:complete len:249 (+) comp58650_c0_seq11:814-1560(+)
MDLQKSRLKMILAANHQYPRKYREFIWRHSLKLPENFQAYNLLVEKGTHPGFANLHEKYPIKSRKYLRLLQVTLSALAHWCPLVAELDFVPLLVFPFVRIFQHNPIALFEISMTFITNWCQRWFEFFPNPPINILSIVETALGVADAEVVQHLSALRVSSQTYAWGLMMSLLSDAVSESDWYSLMDNVLSNPPGYFLTSVVYVVAHRTTILQAKTQLELMQFFTLPQAAQTHVRAIIERANALQHSFA